MNTKPLWAVAVEYYKHGRLVRANIVYLHGTDAAHARGQYCLANPNRRTHKVVAVGPVIGYFVQDDHGDRLTV